MWCPFCCVRVAPGDRQFQADGKIYHDRCYAKAKQLRKEALRVRVAVGETRVDN